MIEKVLVVGAWVFIVIGALAAALGIWLSTEYDGSLEEMADRLKGVRKSYSPVIRFGLLSFIISLIILIAHYI